MFSRSEYRRVIAWPERIRREAPFLEYAFANAPARRLLDVGCGTGEHARFFAERGWTAVGIDVSEDMIADAGTLAGDLSGEGRVRYELRDAAEAADCPEAPFGAALCVGNTLAFMPTETVLEETLAGVVRALAPKAPFLIQLLNYERIASGAMRAMPINFRPVPEGDGAEEIVFLRLMRPEADGSIAFVPVTLTFDPNADPPVTLERATRYTHHPWRRATLEPLLADLGCPVTAVFGGMRREPFDPDASQDLVLLARRGDDPSG